MHTANDCILALSLVRELPRVMPQGSWLTETKPYSHAVELSVQTQDMLCGVFVEFLYYYMLGLGHPSHVIKTWAACLPLWPTNQDDITPLSRHQRLCTPYALQR